MKKLLVLIAVLGMSINLIAQVKMALHGPTYGVKIKANWPGYTGGWARGFSISNQNDTQDFIELGARGSIVNGVSTASYGYIGKNDSNVYMAFKPNGNVGIGTTTPDSKLSVNGTIHSKKVKVDLSGWADYVFKKEYVLPTLEEVAQHIAANGHLKDIPSAAAVIKDGIDL